jgi:transcription initiation factor TFIID subunit 3
MSSDDLFLNLLRPAVLHILRASGFHYGKPSAVDTVVDLTARYISLLAERTAYNAYSNHNDSTPNITDVRMAMQDCGLLVPTMTAGEEEWKQILRKPLDFYNAESGARDMEERRRDAEDTADVREFIEWVRGDHNKEIRRIAGTLKPVATNPIEQLDQLEMEDYLNSMYSPYTKLDCPTAHMLMPSSALMKKHSKTGVESRFQGTVLGVPLEPKTVKIEGGGAESIEEWCRKTRERAAKVAEAKFDASGATSRVPTREPSEDVDMDTI